MLLKIDPVSWTMTPVGVKLGFGATGICRIGDEIFVAVQTPEAPVAVLDARTLRVRNEATFTGARDVHSLVAWQGGLAVASTGTDEVLWYRYDGARLMDRTVLWAAGAERSDTVHVNGLAVHRDRLVCCAFGPDFRTFGPWDESQHGFVYDIGNQRFEARELARPHTVAFIDDELVLCESGRSNLRSLERPLASLHGYTRGIAALDDRRAAVASSGARKRSRSTGLPIEPPRNERSIDGWGIHIVDLDRGAAEWHSFGGFDAEIYDVVRLEPSATPAGA